MKDKLLFVINNMASRYPKDKFIKDSFEPLLKCTESNYFDSKLIIIDDSGDELDSNEYYEYYKEFDQYPKVEVVSNLKNQNLLRSRFKIFDLLDTNVLDKTWIRYLDSGDKPYDNEAFQMRLMMKMDDSNADWYIFQQGIMDDYQWENKRFLDSFYFSTFGDSDDRRRIIEATLSSFNACPMWNKVFRADLLYSVMGEIIRLNNGLPYLFHTEDYLINCIYAFYCNKIATINNVHILYDNNNGDSSSRKVSQEYYDDMVKQLDITRNILTKFYDEDMKTLMPSNIIEYYIDKKLNSYKDRFKVK